MRHATRIMVEVLPGAQSELFLRSLEDELRLAYGEDLYVSIKSTPTVCSSPEDALKKLIHEAKARCEVDDEATCCRFCISTCGEHLVILVMAVICDRKGLIAHAVERAYHKEPATNGSIEYVTAVYNSVAVPESRKTSGYARAQSLANLVAHTIADQVTP